MNHVVLLNILTTLALIVGLFFLLVGALGVLRFPDVYLRMIAASKCVTLGISGMLLAGVFHFIVIGTTAEADAVTGSSAMAATTKAVLVILFQFAAGPVGTHMLARAAHIDRVRMYKKTLSDDLREDLLE
ncbi:MAG: monovalent cation/H(+) antiporter subunit G [Phycisphaerales bacterium]|nr:monovalent cation/H(+) antiporter subunit G [Phycisphaerales bacterium]